MNKLTEEQTDKIYIVLLYCEQITSRTSAEDKEISNNLLRYCSDSYGLYLSTSEVEHFWCIYSDEMYDASYLIPQDKDYYRFVKGLVDGFLEYIKHLEDYVGGLDEANDEALIDFIKKNWWEIYYEKN